MTSSRNTTLSGNADPKDLLAQGGLVRRGALYLHGVNDISYDAVEHPVTGVLRVVGDITEVNSQLRVGFVEWDPASGVTPALISLGSQRAIGIQFPGTAEERIVSWQTSDTLRFYDPVTLAQDMAKNSPVFDPTASVPSLLVLPDGKIIVAGEFNTVDGVTRRRIARLNADGTLDLTFDAGLGTGASFSATGGHRLAVDSLGRVYGAFPQVSSVGDGTAGPARFLSDGTLDPVWPLGTLLNSQPNSSVLVSGDYLYVGRDLAGKYLNVNRGKIQRRLISDGSIDTSFNSTWTGDGNSGSFPRAIWADPDGGVIISGNWLAATSNFSLNQVARLNEDGSEDANFVNAMSQGAGGFSIMKFITLSDGRLLCLGASARKPHRGMFIINPKTGATLL